MLCVCASYVFFVVSFLSTAFGFSLSSQRAGEQDRGYFSYSDGRKHDRDLSLHLKSARNQFGASGYRREEENPSFAAELRLHDWNRPRDYGDAEGRKPTEDGVHTAAFSGRDEGVLHFRHHERLLRNHGPGRAFFSSSVSSPFSPREGSKEENYHGRNPQLLQRRRSPLSSFSLAQLGALEAPSAEEGGEGGTQEDQEPAGEGGTNANNSSGSAEEKGEGESEGGEGEPEPATASKTAAGSEASAAAPESDEERAPAGSPEAASASLEEPSEEAERGGGARSAMSGEEHQEVETQHPAGFSLTTTTTGTPSAFNVDEALHAPPPTGEAGQPFQSQAEKLFKKEEEMKQTPERETKEEEEGGPGPGGGKEAKEGGEGGPERGGEGAGVLGEGGEERAPGVLPGEEEGEKGGEQEMKAHPKEDEAEGGGGEARAEAEKPSQEEMNKAAKDFIKKEVAIERQFVGKGPKLSAEQTKTFVDTQGILVTVDLPVQHPHTSTHACVCTPR